jgi:hypothetical protein
MGLLDDAIRDHLDLKRRRGADPAEIERAEREALGPVRRDPIASENGEESLGPATVSDPSAPGSDPPPAGDSVAAPGAETYGGDFDDEVAEDEDWGDYEEDEYEDLPDIEPSHSDPGPDALAQAPHVPGAPPEPPAPAHAGEDPDATRAFATEPAAETPEGQDEDVLEETPDFLQDTPDHDRLWFEQRPPRDFDFDE